MLISNIAHTNETKALTVNHSTQLFLNALMRNHRLLTKREDKGVYYLSTGDVITFCPRSTSFIAVCAFTDSTGTNVRLTKDMVRRWVESLPNKSDEPELPPVSPKTEPVNPFVEALKSLFME